MALRVTVTLASVLSDPRRTEWHGHSEAAMEPLGVNVTTQSSLVTTVEPPRFSPSASGSFVCSSTDYVPSGAKWTSRRMTVRAIDAGTLCNRTSQTLHTCCSNRTSGKLAAWARSS